MIIEYNGEAKTSTEWARDERVCVSSETILSRISRGWPVEKALFMNRTLNRTRGPRCKALIPHAEDGRLIWSACASPALKEFDGRCLQCGQFEFSSSGVKNVFHKYQSEAL